MVGYPAIGDRIGPYRVDAEIGRGGMGIVYRATQLALNRPVALKILDPRLAADPSFAARFSREATILASLDSPHIIQIFDHGFPDGYLYLAMQYVAGGDLASLISRVGALPPQVALQIFGQLLSALSDAHARGIVHRDVKPSNVLLRPNTVEPFAYLCDFGIAQTQDGGLTQPGQVAGSWAFMSPERHTGQPATPQSDLYSAACVLWSMLTSHNVYSGTDVQIATSHLNAPVPQLPGSDPLIVSLNRLFWTCLAKNPSDRPDTAAEAAALAQGALSLAEGVPPLVVSKPDSGIFRPTTSAPAQSDTVARAAVTQTRSPLQWIIGAAFVVIAVVVGFVLTTRPGIPGRVVPRVPSPTSSATTGAVECWNGVAAAELAQCGNPQDRTGLRWVYLSLDDQWDSCVNKAYRATTIDYDCTIAGRGLIRYRYWDDSDEANRHYTDKYADATSAPLRLDGNPVGTLYRQDKKVGGSYTLSGLWLDKHFSFSVEADTKAERDALLQLVRVRAYDQLTGHATGSAPEQGAFG